MKKTILLSLIFSLFLISCKSDKIKSFEGYKKTNSGLNYKFFINNEGDTPQMLDYLDVQLTCMINDTSVIIPNNRMIWQMIDPLFEGDIFEGLMMMHKGDSASFIVRTDSTFMTLFQLPTLPSQFTNNDVMRFDVKMNDFYPEEEVLLKQIGYIKEAFPEQTSKAEDELRQYLKTNGIDVTPTASGLYYVKTKDGNGEKPNVGSLVSVYYTGKLLNGMVFDSTQDSAEPFQFRLGAGEVISGWDEGIQMMSKGEKGVLYIPFYLAYIDRQVDIISPFSTLIFEVELVDF